MSNFIERLFSKIGSRENNDDQLDILAAKLISSQQSVGNLNNLIAKSHSPGLFSSERDFATQRLLAHTVRNPRPSIILASHPAEQRSNRAAVAQRLLNSYSLAKERETSSNMHREGEDLWSALLESELSEMGSILENNDAEQLAAYLMGFGDSYTWFGGISTSVDGYNQNQDPEHIALSYFEKLVCLGESIGVLNLENPESGPWGDNLFVDINTLVNKIEQKLGISINAPLGIIHTDGIKSENGIYHYRHINALYMAVRTSNLIPKGGAIAEIGGGIGLTAFYSHLLGFKQYSVYDLPLTCMLIGHYLIHALGDDSVSLYGEHYSGTGVQVLPFWEFGNAPSKSVDITINQDAIPEISDNLVLSYLNETKRITKKYFLSMNHEVAAPRTVNNFVDQVGGLKQLYRFKSWVREGYVEECFEIQ